MWVKKFIAGLINMKILPLWGEKWEIEGWIRWYSFPGYERRNEDSATPTALRAAFGDQRRLPADGGLMPPRPAPNPPHTRTRADLER